MNNRESQLKTIKLTVHFRIEMHIIKKIFLEFHTDLKIFKLIIFKFSKKFL